MFSNQLLTVEKLKGVGEDGWEVRGVCVHSDIFVACSRGMDNKK